MQLDQYALTVLIAGKPAKEYGHEGRTFIAGRNGSDYTIRLTNKSPRRVKAVVTVDGLSVIDGKPASMDGPGYIINAWSNADVPGWRVSDDGVARFQFGNPADSYAAQSGKPEHQGVIGAAFFEEEVPEPVYRATLDAGTTTASWGTPKGIESASLRSRSLGGSLGTGFGSRIDHQVRRVDFKSLSYPTTVIEIRYEDAAILRGLGIPLIEEQESMYSPKAFPADQGGYCAPPKNWRG